MSTATTQEFDDWGYILRKDDEETEKRRMKAAQHPEDVSAICIECAMKFQATRAKKKVGRGGGAQLAAAGLANSQHSRADMGA
jgi:hypothetical protein